MARLHIWAPRVKALEIELRGARLPMSAGTDGWHDFDDARLDHDVDYALWLDGKGPFPDPRSAFQPEGCAGPSRYVDHARFAWTDASWQPCPWAEALIYELHIGTFTRAGTFAAAGEQLAHLAALGVTHVELMPVAEFAGTRGWGYDGVNPYAPHHRYGGPEGLKRFVDLCHQQGLATILDVVYNHLGPLGNHLARFGPYFTDRYHTPWGQALNFDGPDCDEVRRFFIDNAAMWLRDYHIDALRIDATHAIVDNSALPFLEQLAAHVKALGEELGRSFTLIAESDLNDPRIVRSVQYGGLGLDAMWNEDHHHALHTLLTDEQHGYYADYGKLNDLAEVFGSGLCYTNRYSVHRRRHHGRSTSGMAGQQLVACTQNHDQIGNRPGGERLGHLVDIERVKLAAAITILAPFVPLLFQGEEWGASTPFRYFTDFPDAALGEAVREGRRQEAAVLGLELDTMLDPQSEAAWQSSVLHWEERDEPAHREVLAWYQALIRLRREHRDLAASPLDPRSVSCDESARWLRLRRGNILVLGNFAGQAGRVPLGTTAPFDMLLSSSPAVVRGRNHDILLPRWGLAVLALEPRTGATSTREITGGK